MSFNLKALKVTSVEDRGSWQNFQGDPPAERDLHGLVDSTSSRATLRRPDRTCRRCTSATRSTASRCSHG